MSELFTRTLEHGEVERVAALCLGLLAVFEEGIEALPDLGLAVVLQLPLGHVGIQELGVELLGLVLIGTEGNLLGTELDVPGFFGFAEERLWNAHVEAPLYLCPETLPCTKIVYGKS